MVQGRSLAFSDDSANVNMPFPPKTTFSLFGEADYKTGETPNYSAIDLFHIRKTQSTWYQDIFQSDREPWTNPYDYVWKACRDMQGWFEELNPRTSSSFRKFFELEMLFSTIYILSPSPTIPNISESAKTVVLDYCTKYIAKLSPLVGNEDYQAPITFSDVYRTHTVGKTLISVLYTNRDLHLSERLPGSSHVSLDTSPQSLLSRSPQVDVRRVVTCLYQIIDLMDKFGTRWGFESWPERFQQECSTLLNDLQQGLRQLDPTAARQNEWWDLLVTNDQHEQSRPPLLSHGSSWESYGSTGSYHSSDTLPVDPLAQQSPSAMGTSHDQTGLGIWM